jgi:hypothetical protein
MKKQTVDSMKNKKVFMTNDKFIVPKDIMSGSIKPELLEDLELDEILEREKSLMLKKLAQQIFADQLEREQSDKLWLLFAKGLALFVVGYMAYHFIRFLMM